MIEKFIVSRDDSIYEAWPDVTLTGSGRLVCMFSECTHHGNRDYTRIVLCTSDDRGRTWSPKRPLCEPLHRADPKKDSWWNCPRISTLSDGRLAVVVDKVHARGEIKEEGINLLWFSSDEGETWDGPYETPITGIVPDQLIELKHGPHAGRWIINAHHTKPQPGTDAQRFYVCAWFSDDQGGSWCGPHLITDAPDLMLTEGSIVELPGNELVCFMRENSQRGLDAFKCISRDGGETWEGPYAIPIPACHRPVAGMLQDGTVLITHRYMQSGDRWLGWGTQNFFGALTDVESCLATERNGAHTRIFPIDFDRSSESDTGYSGWVQFPDGEVYVVNYILDDAPKAHIRGYAFRQSDVLLPAPERG